MNLQLLDGIIAGILAGRKELYNPTYFYGPDDQVRGVLDTIVSDYKEIHPNDSVIRVSGDDYVLEWIYAIKDGTQEAFRAKYRGCGLLAFDRVECLSDRHAVMIEFYELFDSVFMSGGQIILGGSVPPADIALLDDRIRTQMESGMIFRID